MLVNVASGRLTACVNSLLFVACPLDVALRAVCICRWKRQHADLTCSRAILSVINLTWNGLGSNASLLDERPATNNMSHGTTLSSILWVC